MEALLLGQNANLTAASMGSQFALAHACRAEEPRDGCEENKAKAQRGPRRKADTRQPREQVGRPGRGKRLLDDKWRLGLFEGCKLLKPNLPLQR